MNRLFKREIAVTIVKPLGFFNQSPNAITVRDLRVQFTVEKNLRHHPNKCDLTITNLAPETRALLQTKPLYVRLDAGYDGETSRLFAGDVRFAYSEHLGTDWNTTIQLGDGDRAFRFARIARSYREGVDARTAVIAAADAMGLTAKFSPAAERSLRKQFSAGLVVSGRASTELTRLLAPFFLTWSVQDGRLQILGETETRAELAFPVNATTGLVGQPSLSPPQKRGGKPILNLQHLVYARLVPGAKIKVTSRSVNGLFKILRLSHLGDTHGEQWRTEVEAVPV